MTDMVALTSLRTRSSLSSDLDDGAPPPRAGVSGTSSSESLRRAHPFAAALPHSAG